MSPWRSRRVPSGTRFLTGPAKGIPSAARKSSRVRKSLAADTDAGDFLTPPSHASGDAGEPEVPADPAAPKLRGFELGARLGGGGVGEVYEAFDLQLHRTVAVKVLRSGLRAESRQRIVSEARRAAALNHPAIVTIHAVTDKGTTPAIVMERVQGFPIDTALAALSFSQRAGVLQEICRALAHAHGRGIIHRDLKPANVLVTPQMQPKILDFGLAVSAPEATGTGKWFAGTPLYASPEQAAGEALTPASDIFSFGSLMFQVLTGRTPFEGSNTLEVLEAIRTPPPPFLRDLAVGVPEDLQAICLACLSIKPGDRPTAAQLAVEFGRVLAGEPVYLRPALYDDILRRRLSEHDNEILNWEHQGMISLDEADRLQAVHRRILAEEDYWIIDARRITVAQTLLYAGTWLVVVMAFLVVWLLRDDFSPSVRWTVPTMATLALVAVGFLAEHRREKLAAASFLAAAVLSLVPAGLELLADLGIFTVVPAGQKQLFGDIFTNQQVLVVSICSLGLSGVALARLRLTGFAWTTAVLSGAGYFSLLLVCGWLDREPDVRAMWCLPFVGVEYVALRLESVGRVKWAMPFHLGALLALVGALDAMAGFGPTFDMLGLNGTTFLDEDRQRMLSFALNGCVFFVLMLLTERASSLDLRRISRVLEILVQPHLLVPLYVSATIHREDPAIMVDVCLYLAAAVALLVLAPWRSRWRLLIGGLGGIAFGCHLLIDLELVPKRPFVLTIGMLGLACAVGTYLWLFLAPRRGRRKEAGG